MSYLMKIGQYDPHIIGQDKYESIVRLCLHEHDPGILKEWAMLMQNGELENISTVYCSDLLRSTQTVDSLKSQELLPLSIHVQHLDLLREIRFDISTLCTKEEYLNGGSTVVREAFFSHFKDNNLLDSHDNIKQRFDHLKKIIEEHKINNQRVLIVSHTFFIILFRQYLKYSDLFDNVERADYDLNLKHKLMDFGKVVDLQWYI